MKPHRSGPAIMTHLLPVKARGSSAIMHFAQPGRGPFGIGGTGLTGRGAE